MFHLGLVVGLPINYTISCACTQIGYFIMMVNYIYLLQCVCVHVCVCVCVHVCVRVYVRVCVPVSV